MSDNLSNIYWIVHYKDAIIKPNNNNNFNTILVSDFYGSDNNYYSTTCAADCDVVSRCPVISLLYAYLLYNIGLQPDL